MGGVLRRRKRDLRNSVKKLFVLLEIYERASGAKVNLHKTQGFLMGKLRYAKDTPTCYKMDK